MKRTKIQESQIIGILKEQDEGKKSHGHLFAVNTPSANLRSNSGKANTPDLTSRLSRTKELEAELAHNFLCLH